MARASLSTVTRLDVEAPVRTVRDSLTGRPDGLISERGRCRTQPRRGLTLIELVMVVALLGLLAAIAIPGIQMAVEGRRVREAARSLNVYLGSARNRAMVTGRPVGVALRRFENNGNVCFTLDQIESPPVFVGVTLDAFAQVRTGPEAQFVIVRPNGAVDPDTSLAGMIRVGDQIRFNHQGYWYRIDGPDSGDGTITGTPIQLSVTLAPTGQHLPLPTGGSWSSPAPYEIRRQPTLSGASVFRASISKPLQIPLDAVIDLTFSGGSGNAIGRTAFENSDPLLPVLIMFSPTGGLESVSYGMNPVNAAETIYLLVGKRERIPRDATQDPPSNLYDLESLWIAINARTGLVSTVENAPIDPTNPVEPIVQARFFAGDVQTMGGR